MANDYHKIHHIPGTEQEVWTALMNNHNLKDALGLESRGTNFLHSGIPFDWKIDGKKVVGRMVQADTPGTSSTTIVYEWRYDDTDLRAAWPEGQFATTTLVLGEQGDHTYIDLKVTNIPTEEAEIQSRHLWDEKIIGELGSFLDSHPVLEKAA